MTTTHRIAVRDDAYTSVSNGNINCTLIVSTGQQLRVVLNDSEPLAVTPDYIAVNGPGSSTTRAVFTVTGLDGANDLWVRSEAGDTEVVVARGPSVLSITFD